MTPSDKSTDAAAAPPMGTAASADADPSSNSNNSATSKDTEAYTLGSKIVDVLTGRRIFIDTDRARFYLGWAASVLAVLTVASIAWKYQYGPGKDKENLKRLVLPWLAFWTVVPPMFFWFDYFVLWHIEKERGAGNFVDLSEFKHGQELSRNLWLAVVAVLAAIYSAK
jgi:hypothetical protein